MRKLLKNQNGAQLILLLLLFYLFFFITNKLEAKRKVVPWFHDLNSLL